MGQLLAPLTAVRADIRCSLFTSALSSFIRRLLLLLLLLFNLQSRRSSHNYVPASLVMKSSGT